jgi:hypothetical protein
MTYLEKRDALTTACILLGWGLGIVNLIILKRGQVHHMGHGAGRHVYLLGAVCHHRRVWDRLAPELENNN